MERFVNEPDRWLKIVVSHSMASADLNRLIAALEVALDVQAKEDFELVFLPYLRQEPSMNEIIVGSISLKQELETGGCAVTEVDEWCRIYNPLKQTQCVFKTDAAECVVVVGFTGKSQSDGHFKDFLCVLCDEEPKVGEKLRGNGPWVIIDQLQHYLVQASIAYGIVENPHIVEAVTEESCKGQ